MMFRVYVLAVLFNIFVIINAYHHIRPFIASFKFGLLAKKSKYNSGTQGTSVPTKQEKQGKADRFDALTRKFMFTLQGVTKKQPGGSTEILRDINLCFYPGMYFKITFTVFLIAEVTIN